MLIWVCALHCEAKPVIDYYRLKKSHRDNAFDLYCADDMACVISGIGKLACSAASAWVAERYAQAASLAFINLGIAGAAEHETGSLFSLHQVIDGDDGRRYYPAPSGKDTLAGSACMTLARPSDDYSEDYLFDMEASGFMYAGLRFSSAELLRSLKIVSDNRRESIGRDRHGVSTLVQQQMESIDRQARELAAVNGEFAALVPEPANWRRLLEQARFSQTQKNRLRVLWRYLLNREFEAEQILGQLHGRSARAIVERLERLSHQDSERL
jgi:hypothetical protein